MLPALVCTCCERIMSPWFHYWRTRVRNQNGWAFAPIPIKRWRCKHCRRTESALPAFVHRYLHYSRDTIQEVLEIASEGSGLLEVEGPSEETINRWTRELLSTDVERWLSRVFPVCAGSCTPRPRARWPDASRVLQWPGLDSDSFGDCGPSQPGAPSFRRPDCPI